MAEQTELEQAYQALARAHEAGDTAAAKEIAAYAYQLERRAEVAPRQAEQRSLPGKLGRGLVEGVFRRAPESFKQAGVAIGEATGVLPPGSVTEQVAEQNARRLLATGGDQATEEAADIGEMMTLGVPLAGTAARGGKGATSLLGLLGRTSGTAAVETAILLPSSETAENPGQVFAERATAAGLAAGLTAPVAATAALAPALHNWLVKLKKNTTVNEATLKQRQIAGGWLDDETLTISQETGNDIARAIESQVKATAGQNFLNRQVQRQVRRWEALNRWVGRGSGKKPGDVSFLTTARKLSDAWKVGEAQAQAAASRQYGTQLNQVLALAGQSKTRFPVGFSNLSQATDEIAAGSGGRDWWRAIYPGAEAPSAKIRELDAYLKEIKATPGLSQGLDVQEIVSLRRSLNQMDSDFYEAIKNNPNVDTGLLARHATLRKVIRAVDADIDAVIASAPAGTKTGDALRLYRDANKQYGEFKDLQDFMRQTATAQWFGGFQPADAQKFLVKLGGMEPAQQVVLVNTLNNAGVPGKMALHELRMGLVRQALDQARMVPTRVASAGDVDLHKLGTAMMGDNDVLGSRLFTPKQYAEIKKGLAAIRVLDEAPGSHAGNIAPNIESGAMASASLVAPFVARNVWRLVGRKSAEKLLLSERGLKGLNQLADLTRREAGGVVPKSHANDVAKALAFALSGGVVAGEQDVSPELVEWIRANGGFDDQQRP